jgi:MbtH protein
LEEKFDNCSIDGETFVVLLNEQGQYSLWPAGKPIPSGWTGVCPPAPKSECLAFVEAEWTDMRPRSLAAAQKRPGRKRSSRSAD